ncbi:breast cancer metastasis-suppressor 1-like protein [Rhipicephalus microplus]|uniref:breast cancer metastasis-suppressor 1-like protein n=1 Tax=Rhipicephalus microplus TaxID=6941 RepID=UPI003F6B03A4
MPRHLDQGQTCLARPRCYGQLRDQSAKQHPDQDQTVEGQRCKGMARTQHFLLLTAFFRGSSYFEAQSSKIPSVKECNNDNEGKEMDRQTPVSENTNNEDSESSFGSEDDSLEMCEDHCERRLSEYIDDLADLERQLVHLKEQVYLERANQKELKLEYVKLGLAPEYMEPLEDLQNNISKRIKVAGILKKLRLNNIKRKYEAEEIAACSYFESGPALLQDSIQYELEEKIRGLEENPKNIDIK